MPRPPNVTEAARVTCVSKHVVEEAYVGSLARAFVLRASRELLTCTAKGGGEEARGRALATQHTVLISVRHPSNQTPVARQSPTRRCRLRTPRCPSGSSDKCALWPCTQCRRALFISTSDTCSTCIYNVSYTYCTYIMYLLTLYLGHLRFLHM